MLFIFVVPQYVTVLWLVVQASFQDTFLKEQGQVLNGDTWDCLYYIHNNSSNDLLKHR